LSFHPCAQYVHDESCYHYRMELLEGIYTRRSVRQFTGQPVEREQLL